MSEPETEPKTRDIRISEETYELLEQIAEQEQLTPEGAAMKIVTEHMKKLKATTKTMTGHELVKVELEVPLNIVSAISKVAGAFGWDLKKLAVRLMRYALEVETGQEYATFVEDEAERYLKEMQLDNETMKWLSSEVKDLLGETA